MNFLVFGFIYLLSVPILLYLASKVYNKTIYRIILGISILLSFIPISVGIMVLRLAAQGDEWTFWNYVTIGSGLFCIVFGFMALVPMLWMAKQEKPPNK